ncbi:S8 family serine peptidase [Bdellovibrio sp. NC01]|uniref:S8 family serine peptidase n=1 Tax=Bdellovibrio sp. NC01 TaxID=2220073 RepID=UPI001159B997|nr:S8 family serine peptidase [Bdellovibrio sp. NC01]QDK36516.1 protease [Bdellovibrio sp. NC01]
MKFYVSFLISTFISVAAFAGPFTNLDSLKSQLGFAKFYQAQNPGRKLKIAVFDKGFAGFQKEIGVSLPAGTRYIAGPVSAPTNNETEHGLRMAQILTAFMTNDMQASQWAPELTLYNVFGYSNFKAAIDDAIASKVDLILYSEVWQYGGNNDGKGFINKEVNRATSAGIIWVNAAGNFDLTTYNSTIQTIQDNWVRLPDQNNALAIRCEQNETKSCFLRVVLSWNDFKDNVDLGTKKDLDLVLTDDTLNVLQVGATKQSDDVNESRPGFSKYPREIIETQLSPGLYFLRVKNRSGNFAAQDSLRISIEPDNITMPSHSINESVLNPADNPTVIAVGASDFPMSSRSASSGKPDIFAPSRLQLQDGRTPFGSSNSAAIVAAGLGLLKSQQPKLGRADLLRIVKSAGAWNQSSNISLNVLGFRPTGPGCFVDMAYPNPPAYLRDVFNKGGVLVATTIGNRIIVPFDPITLASGLRRQLINDMIVALPQGGYAVYNRYAAIPAGAAEIFQRPIEAGLCRASSFPANGFYLP